MADMQMIYETLDMLTPIEREQARFYLEHGRQMTEEEAIRWALGDSVIWADTSDDSDSWVEEYADEIDRAFRGEPPLSQLISEDRGEI